MYIFYHRLIHKAGEEGGTEDEMVGWHVSMDMCVSKLWELAKDREDWHTAVPGLQSQT